MLIIYMLQWSRPTGPTSTMGDDTIKKRKMGKCTALSVEEKENMVQLSCHNIHCMNSASEGKTQMTRTTSIGKPPILFFFSFHVHTSTMLHWISGGVGNEFVQSIMTPKRLRVTGNTEMSNEQNCLSTTSTMSTPTQGLLYKRNLCPVTTSYQFLQIISVIRFSTIYKLVFMLILYTNHSFHRTSCWY